MKRLASRVAAAALLSGTVLAGASAPATAADPPVISVIQDYVVQEGNTSAAADYLVFTRSGDLSKPSTVQLTIADGTATAGTDYTAAKYVATLTFPADADYVTYQVKIKGDVVVEPSEYFVFYLSSPVGATIGDGTGFFTILNDDSDAAPTFSIEDEPYLQEENAGRTKVGFLIDRAGSTAAAASVKVSTADGTAVAPGDYTRRTPTVVRFAVGQTQARTFVYLHNDLVPEPDEYFTVNLTSPIGATIADRTAVGLIHNDDSSATPSISVFDGSVYEGDRYSKTYPVFVHREGNLQGTSKVTVTTVDGTATSPDDYVARSGTVTFFPGDTDKYFNVTIKGDTSFELDSAFTVTLSGPTGGVIGQGSATIEIWNDDE